VSADQGLRGPARAEAAAGTIAVAHHWALLPKSHRNTWAPGNVSEVGHIRQGSRNVFAVSETEPWTHRAVIGSQRLSMGLAVSSCIPWFLGWLAQSRAFLAGLTCWPVRTAVIDVTEWRDG